MAGRHFHDWPSLVEKAAGLVRSGKCQPYYGDIADALGVSRKTVDEKFRKLGITCSLLATPDKWPKIAQGDHQSEAFEGIAVKDVIRRLRQGPLSIDALADALDRGTPAVERALKAMRAAGYGIVRDEQLVKLPPYTPPQRAPVLSDAKSRHFAFAVGSDPHIASKAAQISALKGFLEIAVKRHGVQHVLFSGDLSAGMGVYRGQQNEVYAVGASEQCDALVNTIPEFAGVRYYMLGGNHDYCADANTEYLSTSGWKKFGSLDSSPIATLNPWTHAFEWQQPKCWYVNERYQGPLVTFDHTSVDIAVTPNHDLYVQSTRTEKWGKCRAGDMPKAGIIKRVLRTAEQWNGSSGPDPGMTRLIGWYVSEGNIDGQRICISQSREKSPYFTEIIDLITSLGYKPCQDHARIRFNAPELVGVLEKFGRTSYAKTIRAALDWDRESLRLLLDTLLKGDAHQDNPNHWTYTTASDQLADDLCELAVKVGMAANAGPRCTFPVNDGTGYVGTARRVYIGTRVTSLVYHPKDVSYSGLVYCPSVPNGIWLARRNGKVSWTGNSFHRTNGYNIIEAACALRKDWIYLGYDEAVVPLTPDLDIVLWHPSGGLPYAISYRGQKYAAELAQRELMDIIVGKKDRPRTRFIFWGHLHVAASFPHGPIRVIGPGCFEGRNGYLKQKGLTPKIQGVVIECWLTDDGLIQRHVAHEYEYVEAEDDWKNAYIPSVARRPREVVKVMFSLKPQAGGCSKGHATA